MNLKKKNQLKSIISKLFLGIYFLALFSQTFHDHNSGHIFQHFNLKKSENTISKDTTIEKSGDCLACHFLATGNAELPTNFDFSFVSYSQKVKLVISVQEKIWEQTKYTFQLRGPPSIS